MSETIRAGLTSVRRNQMQAALALGMSRFQAIKTIVLPQAIIRMLPALGSLFVIAIKDSAIASVIAVPELLRQTQIVAGKTFRPFELYTAAMLAYFILCYPVARGVSPGCIGAFRIGLVMTFDWNIVWSSLPALLDGAWMTIWLSIVTMLLAIPGGLALALLRLSGIKPLAMAATAFVEFFRATPLILQIYWVYYVLPAYFDIQLSLADRSPRRPRLQYLGLQFGDLPVRHRLDPARASGMPAWRSA